MGRKRIKKKDSVLPFRQTVAYRFIMVAAAFVLFVITSIWIVRSIQVGNVPTIVVSAVLTAAAAFSIIYNLNRMHYSKVPRHTAQKMKRHRS